MLFRHILRKIDTLLFFYCVGEVFRTVNLKKFFLAWVRFWVEVFSYCSFTETFAIVFRNWIDHKMVDCAFFCWNMPCFVVVISAWTAIYEKCSIVFFCRHQIFSIFSLYCILFCSLNEPVLFSHKILWNRLMSFCNTCNFTSYVCASSILAFPQVMIDFWRDFITCKSGNLQFLSEQFFLFHSLKDIFIVIELLAKLSLLVIFFHSKGQVIWKFRDNTFDRHFCH